MQKLREISFLLRSYLQEVDMEVVDSPFVSRKL